MVVSSLLNEWHRAPTASLTSDAISFMISSVAICLAFFSINSFSGGNRKSTAWIIMLISSAVLSFFGTVYVAQTEYYSLWTNEFIYGEDKLSRFVILFFMASNLVDLIIGWFFYKEFLDPFTTVFHHIAYMAFMIGLLRENITRGFLLCFFMEIPTFCMSLGTVFKAYRSDTVFGVTFFITRLVFNAYLIIRLANITNYEGYIWKICSFVLCVHIYWFYKWFNSYGRKAIKTLTSQEALHKDPPAK